MRPSVDIVKPHCPNWAHHYQLRKWVASLPSHAWEDDDYVYLLVKPSAHPCTWYITREDLLTPTVRGFRNLARALNAASITVCKRKRY